MTAPALPPEQALRLPDDVVDAAVTWSVKIDHSPSTQTTRQAFAQWLQADPLHALAWSRIGSVRSDLARLPARLALDTLQAAELQREPARGSRPGGRRQLLKLFSLAGATAGLGWVLHEQAPWQRLQASTFTAVGEQKTLHLADGTVMMLNTDSAVSTDLDGALRLVVLRRGEIRVSTGADAGATARGAAARRPFWVHTPFGRLQALGTRFVVRLDPGRARVAVQEGAVALYPARPGANDGGPALVHAGESRWLSNTGSAAAQDPGFEADAWVDGVVAGRNIRLDDWLAQLSRYRSGHVSCDPRVAGLRVSGVFHLRDTDQALRFLASTQPVSVIYRTRWWVTVGPRP
ncbi:FecR domain-containing protein [Aquabacterium sp. OR-4]|uniref:FecR domain-containing protein n=1 Tax=Aquabacterium sp. OR-4 TaxID=2978127 RepID=UPI0028C76CFB|nr:FecR domain-containing protein [Aquabacterium sp. OR-4]MDT7834800.1 FecR domain-containing protein [Aquabacterium sp. OR-4]